MRRCREESVERGVYRGERVEIAFQKHTRHNPSESLLIYATIYVCVYACSSKSTSSSSSSSIVYVYIIYTLYIYVCIRRMCKREM